MPKRRLALVANPHAAGGRAAHVIPRARQALIERGMDVDVWAEDSQSTLALRVRAELAHPPDAVVALGGDGTVHLVLNETVNQACPLGVIPVGTGNDIATSWGVPAELERAVDFVVDALDAPTRTVDLAEATHGDYSRLYAAVYSAGFDAIVNERANRMRFPKGPSRYTLALLAELTKLAPRRYELTIDGQPREVQALLIAVANGPSFGGGMQIVPDALVDDGLLDVFIVHPVSTVEFLTLYPKVFSGAHVGHPAVEIVRCRQVELHSEGIVGYADGERLRPLPVSITARPRALRVLASEAFGQ